MLTERIKRTTLTPVLNNPEHATLTGTTAMHRTNILVSAVMIAMLSGCGESDQEKIQRLEMELAQQKAYTQGMAAAAQQTPQIIPQAPTPQFQGAAPQPVVINTTTTPAQVAESTGIDAGDLALMAMVGATGGLLAYAAMPDRTRYASQYEYDRAYSYYQADRRRVQEYNRKLVADARTQALRAENKELQARIRNAELQARANATKPIAQSIPQAQVQRQPAITQNTQNIQVKPSGGLFAQKNPVKPQQPYAQPAQRQGVGNQPVQQSQPAPRQGFSNQQQVQQVPPNRVEYKPTPAPRQNVGGTSSRSSTSSSSSSSRSSSRGR